MEGNPIVHLTSGNFQAEVLDSKMPVLVDFWADWCGPCRQIAPVIDEIAKEYEGRMKVGKVNVDQEQDLAVRYGVMSIPTLVLFQNGQAVERLVGAMPKDALKRKLEGLL
ncbi:MAG: thioredoxin [Limnochordia bacterium]|jgi:thioredoxin 1|nr:thioredoxin [Bacillota bacterium]